MRDVIIKVTFQSIKNRKLTFIHILVRVLGLAVALLLVHFPRYLQVPLSLVGYAVGLDILPFPVNGVFVP